MEEKLTVLKGKEKLWKEAVEKNQDPYGYAVVEATVIVGKALDEDRSPKEAHDKMYGLGLTGFMAGAVASWISQFHPRGEEFRRWWNEDIQIGNEGEKANKEGGVLSPALLNIGEK